MSDEKVDPRTEADAQVARALQIVVDADCTLDCLDEDPGNGHRPDCKKRDYTPDELETLFFALSMAMVQLQKLEGGKEARERFYHRAIDVIGRRGREDIIDVLTEEKTRRAEARKIVKKAFGDNVDMTPGTSGYALFKVVELQLQDVEKLRAELTALAASLAG